MNRSDGKIPRELATAALGLDRLHSQIISAADGVCLLLDWGDEDRAAELEDVVINARNEMEKLHDVMRQALRDSYGLGEPKENEPMKLIPVARLAEVIAEGHVDEGLKNDKGVLVIDEDRVAPELTQTFTFSIVTRGLQDQHLMES